MMSCACFSCVEAAIASTSAGFPLGGSCDAIIATDSHHLSKASPDGPIKVAVTVDDLLLWDGMPWAPGYDADRVVKAMTSAFTKHGIKGVYGFSSSAPLLSTPSNSSVFDHWAAEGHYTSNHTHYHANLNWVSASNYIADIEQSEAIIDRWSSSSPKKYFRYAMDNWGNTQFKFDNVKQYLSRNNYQSAPVGVWFYDTEFLVPHLRAITSGDSDALTWVRKSFIATALKQLRVHAAAARLLFGRDPIYIWLIHGTPLAADCIEQILDGFQAMGSEFVSLDEAMADPVNREPAPLITPRFLNQIMKWAEIQSVPIEDCPPAILKELELVSPIPGIEGPKIMIDVFKGLSDKLDGDFFPKIL
jgi:peptidoglycan/xylan/chitin deacetylase (PgdA/CDA1 family)